MKKFLICGLGSIGQRHVRMIQAVTQGKAEIAAYRTRKLSVIISDKLEAKFDIRPEDHYGLKTFDSLPAALEWKPDMVFVTNPISMHLETALAAAEAGCHVFIEKPIDSSPELLPRLQRAIRENRLSCMIGYQLRYHPGYQRIKNLLETRALGQLISADLHFGEWLPGMHPYEDYRESHAARCDQGGGVVLCLSHEIDIAYWLFGKPSRIVAMGGHLSNLEMDTEDTADVLLSCRQGEKDLPVHIHLDFLQKPMRRYIHIAGEKGSLTFDYPSNRMQLNLLGAEPEITLYDGFQRNDMFLGEVRDFIASATNGTPPPISLDDGAAVLEICLAIKRSMSSGKVEQFS